MVQHSMAFIGGQMLVDGARSMVEKADGEVIELIKEYAENHLTDFDSPTLRRHDMGVGWQVFYKGWRGRERRLLWITIYVYADRSYCHIHMALPALALDSEPLQQLAHELSKTLEIPVTLFPPNYSKRLKLVRDEYSPQGAEYSSVVIGGMLGADAIAVVQLLGRTDMTTALKWAVGVFAVAIPLLTAALLSNEDSKVQQFAVLRNLNSPLMLAGLLASATGYALLFFHFGWVVGIIFSFAALVAAIVVALNMLGVAMMSDYWHTARTDDGA